MTVLYLFVISGLRRGFTRPGTAVVVTALWAALATATLMISRNQILAIALASVALPFYLPQRVAVRSLGLGILLVGITVAVIWGSGDRVRSVFGVDIEEQLSYQLGRTVSTTWGTDKRATTPGDSLLARPFLLLDDAVDRWSPSPLVGTGFESATGGPRHSYHNDWLGILTSTGMLGFAAFALIAWRLFRLEPVLIVPFILPGLTNAFLFAPQHFILVMMLAGIVAARRHAE